jgi:hypothetical protein
VVPSAECIWIGRCATFALRAILQLRDRASRLGSTNEEIGLPGSDS